MSLRTQGFLAGIRAEIPILAGVIPFGLIYGALALNAGIPPVAAQSMSAIIFGGSAQFITAQLVHTLTPGPVIVLTVAVVNLRHALYSASIAPYLRKLSPAWKAILAYLLTDEAYAVTIVHYDRSEDQEAGHWFFLGAGVALWTTWQISTAAGILLGAVIPESWTLDFTLALTFIALTVPMLKDRPAIIAALTAGLTALLTYNFPYKLGLLAAALAGILAGLGMEKTR